MLVRGIILTLLTQFFTYSYISIMIRYICLSLLLSLTLVSNTFSQNIFELKGKNIILTSDKIAYKGDYNAYNRWSYFYHENFGKIYNSESLRKYKFSNKNLYSGNIVGKTLFVSDVRIINQSSIKKKAILILFNTQSDTLVMYLPLHLKTNAHIGGFRVDVEVYPEEINLCYHDCDEINRIKNQMQNKRFYFKGENKLYTFDNISLEKDWVHVQYCDETFQKQKYYIRAHSTEKHINYEHNYNSFNTFTSSILFEDDLISQCRQRNDNAYILALTDSLLNKEIYLSSGAKRGFYICENIGIENVGTKEPCYNYILTLRQDKNIIKLPIQKDMSHIVLAEIYREKQRIKEEKRQREEAEYQAMLEKEEREYKANLIKKYGKRNALLILDNIVQIGFTKEMCIEAWGEPYDINRTVTIYGTHEQWVYDIGRYLYFDNNILTAIQD